MTFALAIEIHVGLRWTQSSSALAKNTTPNNKNSAKSDMAAVCDASDWYWHISLVILIQTCYLIYQIDKIQFAAKFPVDTYNSNYFCVYVCRYYRRQKWQPWFYRHLNTTWLLPSALYRYVIIITILYLIL